MEKSPSGGSPKQQNKAKKKQIKVVYITNPMRVKTTAAEFKGLVQELTGQDSDIAERLMSSKFEEEMEQAADRATASTDRASSSSDGSLAGPLDSGGNGEIQQQQQQQQQQRLPSEDKGTGTPYDLLDEDFPAQILEDFESLIMPSSSYYESSPAIDDSKKNLDTA